MQADDAVTVQRATELAAQLRINLKKVGGIEWWHWGVQYERERVQRMVECGAKFDAGVDLDVVAAKNAMAMLRQWPDWYERLKATEDRAIKYWRNIS